jgi:hypothetical protein
MYLQDVKPTKGSSLFDVDSMDSELPATDSIDITSQRSAVEMDEEASEGVDRDAPNSGVYHSDEEDTAHFDGSSDMPILERKTM